LISGSSMACSQPAIECQVAMFAPYTARFTPTRALPACAQDPSFSGKTFDLVGLEFFHPERRDASGEVVGYDADRTSIAIKSELLGEELYARDPEQGRPDPDPDHHAYSLGDFTSMHPDAQGMCSVPRFAIQTEQELPAIDGIEGTAPAKHVTYAWSDFRVYVTASAQGTQFSSDLVYTENGCSVPYRVTGMWPAAGCYRTDDTGAPLLDEDGKAVPDATLCSPCPQLGKKLPLGSGLNEEFPTTCEPFADGLYYCVLAEGEIPVLTTPPSCEGS
jgi:hypothetical protein